MASQRLTERSSGSVGRKRVKLMWRLGEGTVFVESREK